VGTGHFLKIKLRRVDCEKQSPRGFSDVAIVQYLNVSVCLANF